MLLGLKTDRVRHRARSWASAATLKRESDAEAGVREVWEEAGVVVRQEDLADAGVVEFLFPTRPEWNMYCRLFTTRRWAGEPAESPEKRRNGSIPGRCRCI